MPEVPVWVAIAAFIAGYVLRALALAGSAIDSLRRLYRWWRPVPPRVRFAGRGGSGTGFTRNEDGTVTWDNVQPGWIILNLGPGRIEGPRSGIVGPDGERLEHPLRPAFIAEEDDFSFGTNTGYRIPAAWLGTEQLQQPQLHVAYFVTCSDTQGRRWDGVFDPRVSGDEGEFELRPGS